MDCSGGAGIEKALKRQDACRGYLQGDETNTRFAQTKGLRIGYTARPSPIKSSIVPARPLSNSGPANSLMDGDAVIVTHQNHAAAASPVIKIEAKLPLCFHSFLSSLEHRFSRAPRLRPARFLPGEEDDEASN